MSRLVRILVVLVLTGAVGACSDDGTDRAADARRVAEQLRDGEIDAVWERFTEAMRADVSKQEMADVWAEAIEWNGEVTEIGDADDFRHAGVTVWELPIDHEDGESHLQIAYRGDRIGGMYLLLGPPSGKWGA